MKQLPAVLVGCGATLVAAGLFSNHVQRSATIELFYDAQLDEIAVHEVSKVIYTDSVKMMRIRDIKSQLTCWSITLGKSTHAVTCG